MKIRRKPNPTNRKGGWVQVGFMAASYGLSLIAAKLLEQEPEAPMLDDKPTTLSTRGSYTSWHIGIRALGPVFCFAGDRRILQEAGQGGKKGAGGPPDKDVIYETGLHVLGVGPMGVMHKITSGGEVVFQGPISSESHPSGTYIKLSAEEGFSIYWGEKDQPVNSFLNSKIGINSRWPHFCYVVWNQRRLGGSPNWAPLTYVMERQTQDHSSALPSSQSWYNPGMVLSGFTGVVSAVLADADQDVGYIQIAGAYAGIYNPLDDIELTGVGMPDGTYQVKSSRTITVQAGTHLNALGQTVPTYVQRTQIHLVGGTVGATATGTVQDYSPDNTAGANIAHAQYEMLFSPYPLGAGMDPNGIEGWDLESLDALGVEAEANAWRSSLVVKDGATVDALLGTVLQDHGCMLPEDTQTGKIKWARVREPSGILPDLGEEIYVGNLPEISVQHGERPVDDLIFVFKDRAHNFGDMTISIDEDGQASYLNVKRGRRVRIPSTVLFSTASDLAELRSPEELAGAGEFSLDAGRAARTLLPGDAVTGDGFPEGLLVIGVGRDPESERTKLEVIPNYYGARKTSFANEEGGGAPVPVDPENDLSIWVEVPQQLLDTQTPTIIVPRIRAHENISSAVIYLSQDNVTYVAWGSQTSTQTGGFLTEALTADGPTFMAQGPEYSEVGPDNGSLTQDLSADLTNWGLGRQIAVISSSNGVEFCFVQKATIISAGVRRLDGLLRARFDSRKLDHAIDAEVYILDYNSILTIQDLLLEINSPLFTKSQAASSSGSMPVDSVSPWQDAIIGKAPRPVKPDYIRVTAPIAGVAAYHSGEDVTVWAAVSSAESKVTGAGFQSAGDVIEPPDIQGTIVFEIRTLADALLFSISVQTLDHTFTNAQLVSLLGSETDFKVFCYHSANGYSTESVEVTIEKLL